MSERRNPVPSSAKYYHDRAMAGHDTGLKLTWDERCRLMKEAFNHLENAAFAEAEQVDKLRTANAKLVEACRNAAKTIEGHFGPDHRNVVACLAAIAESA
jgi:hypothetical protein